jgi:hypothetical protein
MPWDPSPLPWADALGRELEPPEQRPGFGEAIPQIQSLSSQFPRIHGRHDADGGMTR